MKLVLLIASVVSVISLGFLGSRKRLIANRCAPQADLVRVPRTMLKVYAREADALGLVARFGAMVDKKSKGRVYVRFLTFNLHGFGANVYYTLDAVLVGDLRFLEDIQRHINSGNMYETDDPEMIEAIASAKHMVSIPRSAQFSVALEVVHTDEPNIVKTVAATALQFGGNASRFHAETVPGRFPSMDDCYISATYHFPSRESAQRAIAAMKSLPYEIVRAKALADEDSDNLPPAELKLVA